MQRLNPSTICRRAARRIEQGTDTFSCCAIQSVSGGYNQNYIAYRRAYLGLFVDDNRPTTLQLAIIAETPGSSDGGTFIEPTPQRSERRDLRVMLLCMAAAVMGYRPRKRK